MPDNATIVALRSDTAATPTAKREAPQEQPDRPGAMPSALEKPARSPRRPWRRWALFALLALAVIVGCYWYITGGAVMSTDDSYVEADKVGISTDISGIVADVDVTDNQHVAAGQILYRLDPRQFQIALDNAKANLAETALSIEAMKEDYKRMLSDAAAQQAQVESHASRHGWQRPAICSARAPTSPSLGLGIAPSTRRKCSSPSSPDGFSASFLPARSKIAIVDLVVSTTTQ